MDGVNLILTTPVMPPTLLEKIAADGLNGIARKTGSSEADTAKTEKLAKDFESVLLTKLFDEMKETVGNWGFEEDAASGQVQGLFWLYLARDVADKGGLGLWKDLQQFFNDLQNQNQSPQSLDESL